MRTSTKLLLVFISLLNSACETRLNNETAKQQIELYLENNTLPLTNSIETGIYEFNPAPVSLSRNEQKTVTIDTLQSGAYKDLKSSGYVTTEFKGSQGRAPTMYLYDIHETNKLIPLITKRVTTKLGLGNSSLDKYTIYLQTANIANLEITGMLKDSQSTYIVEFKYNEILNDIGKLTQKITKRSSLASKVGIAQFLKYDDGWRLKQLETHAIGSGTQGDLLSGNADSNQEISYINIEIINQNCWPQDFWIDEQPIVAIPANDKRTIKAIAGTHVTMACGAGSTNPGSYHQNCGSPTEVTWQGDNLKHTIFRNSDCPALGNTQKENQPIENKVSNINTPDTQAPSTVPPTSNNASFDCNRARMGSEIAICNNSELRQFDIELASLYRSQLKNYKQDSTIEKKLRDTQKSWLSERNLCTSDIPCLRVRYQERIMWLREFEAND